MELFYATVEQMIFLFLLIVIGYIVRKTNSVPQEAARILQNGFVNKSV